MVNLCYDVRRRLTDTLSSYSKQHVFATADFATPTPLPPRHLFADAVQEIFHMVDADVYVRFAAKPSYVLMQTRKGNLDGDGDAAVSGPRRTDNNNNDSAGRNGGNLSRGGGGNDGRKGNSNSDGGGGDDAACMSVGCRRRRRCSFSLVPSLECFADLARYADDFYQSKFVATRSVHTTPGKQLYCKLLYVSCHNVHAHTT
jgi:hypothetical protein